MSAQEFMPHGICLSWMPDLLLLHVISDITIALAYFSIPFALLKFARQRKDLVYTPILYLFSFFILACGMTHIFDVWVIWEPHYVAQGLMKSVTALISALTAVYLWPVVKRAISLPSHALMEAVNLQLNQEVEEHRTAVAQLSEEIVRRQEAQSRFEQLNDTLEQTINERTRQLQLVSDDLKKSEERLRLAVEASGIGFSEVDLRTGDFIYHSQCSSLIDSQDRCDKIDTLRAWVDRIHPDDKAEVHQHIETCLAQGETYDIEYRIRGSSGEYRWIWARGRALEYTLDHRPVRVLSTHIDIHTRKTNELHSKQLALIIENSSDLIGHADVNQNLIYMNPAGRKMLGIDSSQDVSGTRITDYQPAWASAKVAAEGISTALSEGVWQGDTAFIRKDGSEFQVSQMIVIQKHPRTGGIESISTVCRDISDRLLAKDLIKKQKETLEIAVNGARIGVWDWDILTNEVSVSEMFRSIFGLTDTESFTYERFIEALHPDDRFMVLEAVRQVLQKNNEYDSIYRIVRSDGSTRWISALGRGYVDESHHPVRMMGVCIDITDKKLLEDQFHRNVEQLEIADRRKDEFIALLAHELRNPLAPIKMIAHLLTEGGLSPDRYRWCCESLERQTKHLTKLVDDLLDVSRISRGLVKVDRELIDIESVVHQAEEISRPQFTRNQHTYTADIPKTPIYVLGDRVRLTQVISNLLNNAAKYTPPGGVISVSVQHSGQSVIISVKDNGIGISRENLGSVFALFNQIAPATSTGNDGLGIGLYLSKQLILLHGGNLEARSEGLGKGSEFIIHLVVEDPPSQLIEGEAAKESDSMLGHRVLIVDDNVDAAEGLSCFLELKGFKVEKAFDGFAALNSAEQFHPEIILLDIGMPGMDGYETCRKIRSEPWGKNILIVAVSGWGQVEDKKRSSDAGFDEHLVKPVDLELLDAIIQKNLSADLNWVNGYSEPRP